MNQEIQVKKKKIANIQNTKNIIQNNNNKNNYNKKTQCTIVLFIIWYHFLIDKKKCLKLWH